MRLHIALIVLAGALVYGNGLSGPLLFDDENSILNNRSIRQLTPLSGPLSPPRDTPVAGRPVVNLTFAVNYAIGGLDVTGYHVANLAIHLLAALTLYGIVRRALRLTRVPRSLHEDADLTALAVAVLWVVHPLNSESVSYLTERTESLMALFYLLTLYAAIRAATSTQSSTWTAAAVVSSALGMASKESMITAPVMVLLFDRVFLYGSWREAWAERRYLYGGLAASWVVLGLILWSEPRTTVGFGTNTTPWVYFLNQLQVITRYLWLAVWPQGARPRLRAAAPTGDHRRDRPRCDPAGTWRLDGVGAVAEAAAGVPGRVGLRHAVAHLQRRADRDGGRGGAPDVSGDGGAGRAGRGGRAMAGRAGQRAGAPGALAHCRRGDRACVRAPGCADRHAQP